MKCPECVKEGKRSTVSQGMSMTTCMGWAPFYDEDGNYHSHDPNRHETAYSCSNGHYFGESSVVKCPSCDYGAAPAPRSEQEGA